MSVHRAVSNLPHRRLLVSLLMVLSSVPISLPAETKAGKTKASKKAKESSPKTVGAMLKRIGEQNQKLKIKKSSNILPQFEALKSEERNLKDVKPPQRSRVYYSENANEAELEKAVDDGIGQLYKLAVRFKQSSKRGELWLRLAELYVEKARLIEYKIQNLYDKRLTAFQDGKLKTKPNLDTKPAQTFNRKAIQLYEWFLRDFPKDPKEDQALFFLGYNHTEIGDEKKGLAYYSLLSKRHPNSPYVDEANFALGEYYFEKDIFEKSRDFYKKVTANSEARLYSFALYKQAWSEYKLGQVESAMKSLERVIISSKKGTDKKEEGTVAVSGIRLASEAIKDLVVFYAEVGTAEKAREYFSKIGGADGERALLEKLAYYYKDSGSKTQAKYLFKDLIEERPYSAQAFEYQYQIVKMYASTDQSIFRDELYKWIEVFGPNGIWSRTNKDNQQLVLRSGELIEVTLRNYILQQHQTAQNSRAPNAQKQALSGYDLYMNTFEKTPKMDEMRFFFGELLFDMGDYNRSAAQYVWVYENASVSKYAEKSLLNALLALEKGLPTTEEIKKLVGQSLTPLEFDRNVQNFEKVATVYLKKFPKADDAVAIKYRLGALHYYYNHFDEALSIFAALMKEWPASSYAEFAANLTLDVYNLRKDYEGLESAADSILANPNIAKSQTGAEIREIRQKTALKRAQDFEKQGDFENSAKAYEAFFNSNSTSELATVALFNAAVNFERVNDLSKAVQLYGTLASRKDKRSVKLAQSARKSLALLSEKLGMYAKAAVELEKFANDFPSDPDALNFLYNAALIRDGMNFYQSAQKNFEAYFSRSKKAEKVEALFLLAKMFDRKGEKSKAANLMKQYVESYPKNGLNVTEANLYLAKYYEESGSRKKAEEFYRKTVGAQKRWADTKPKVTGAAFAAEAKFKLVNRYYEDLVFVRIPRNPEGQSKAVQQKISILNQLKDQLKKVVEYDDGPMIVASLVLQGQAFQHMASAIYKAPIPEGLAGEDLQKYREGIDKIAKPFIDQAIEGYQSAIKQGTDKEAYTPALLTAMRELNKLDSKQYVNRGEKVFLTRLPEPISTEAEYRAAADAVARKSEEGVIKAVKELLAKNPKDIKALNALGNFYFNEEKFGLAKIIWARALEAAPEDPGLLNNMGVIALSAKDMRAAIGYFRKALNIKSDYRLAATNLSSIYLEYKDYSRALAPLEDAYKIARKDLADRQRSAHEVVNNYALALMGNGQYNESNAVFKEVIESGADAEDILLNHAILLIEVMKKKDGEAKKALSKLKLIADSTKLKKKLNLLEKTLDEDEKESEGK